MPGALSAPPCLTLNLEETNGHITNRQGPPSYPERRPVAGPSDRIRPEGRHGEDEKGGEATGARGGRLCQESECRGRGGEEGRQGNDQDKERKSADRRRAGAGGVRGGQDGAEAV